MTKSVVAKEELDNETHLLMVNTDCRYLAMKFNIWDTRAGDRKSAQLEVWTRNCKTQPDTVYFSEPDYCAVIFTYLDSKTQNSIFIRFTDSVPITINTQKGIFWEEKTSILNFFGWLLTISEELVH